MIQLKDENICTGCMACVNVCPEDAISIHIKKDGFEYPCIDRNKCIACNLCVNTCKSANEITLQMPKVVYASWTKDESIRLTSSSGGVFTVLAEHIIEKGGYVFGAAFNSNMDVAHKCINEQNEISQLRGSKYVQSSIGWCYRNIDKLLKEQKIVLFSGTPCQVAGLYAFLGKKEIKNLYTIDLICHGVPSPKVFKAYKKVLEERFESKIQKISFRDKNRGWFEFSIRIMFENKAIYQKFNLKDPFFVGFLRNLYLRSSCYKCAFRHFERCADITLGDFWGYQDTCKADMDDDKGISQVMINSKNGGKLFNEVTNKLIYFERSFEEAKSNGGFYELPEKDYERELFWTDFETQGFDGIEKKYLFPQKRNKFFYLRRIALKTPYSLRILKRKILHK